MTGVPWYASVSVPFGSALNWPAGGPTKPPCRGAGGFAPTKNGNLQFGNGARATGAIWLGVALAGGDPNAWPEGAVPQAATVSPTIQAPRIDETLIAAIGNGDTCLKTEQAREVGGYGNDPASGRHLAVGPALTQVAEGRTSHFLAASSVAKCSTSRLPLGAVVNTRSMFICTRTLCATTMAIRFKPAALARGNQSRSIHS